MARVITRTGSLDFHHVCSQIRKQLPAPRPRENAREFDHLDAGERFHILSRHPSESWDLNEERERPEPGDPSFRWGDANGG